MSKFKKIMMLILLLGLILIVTGYIEGGFRTFEISDFKISFSDDKTIIKESYTIDDVKQIKINVESVEEIDIHMADEFKLEMEACDLGNGKKSISYGINDGILNVNQESDDRKITFGFLNNSKEKIKITIPKDFSLENFELESDYSNINISDVSLKKALIQSDYGNINSNNISINDDLSIKADYGDINIDNIYCNNLNVTCDYGDVNIQTAEKENLFDYTLETTYGDIKLNGNSFEDNYSRNNNATKRMNVICNYGDIEIDTLKN